MHEQQEKPPKLVLILRIADLVAAIGLGRSKIYELVADGEFPRPVQLGPRATGWLRSEVEEWIASRPRATGDRPAT